MKHVSMWSWIAIAAAAVLWAAAGCTEPGGGGTDNGGPRPDATDGDTGRDDATADDGRDVPRETGPDASVSGCGEERSYIWIANSAEGTLSKLCTLDGVEVGRYWTSPQTSSGDPSRTSVNMHGDMVVTNRNTEGGPSSVTKFAAEPRDCIDRDADTRIRTSTSATDVLPWGQDECMIWNAPLPDASATTAIGARATAWDGTEDPETGEGGFVWIGALNNNGVYKLDGDTGEIVGRTSVTNQPYGGVIDGRGGFWIVGAMCTVGMCNLARVNTETLAVDVFSVPCGYGISADRHGRIWTSGKLAAMGSCVNRLDPGTRENVTYRDPRFAAFYRGIAVDDAGSIWVANTGGTLVQVREDNVTPVTEFPLGAAEVVGVAIDFQGNVWAVSQGSNAVIKVHPTTYELQTFPVGRGPYTYSDMTGFQLNTVILI